MKNVESNSKNFGWRFWVDKGGTFTDVVALNSDGNHFAVKVLSGKFHDEDSTLNLK